MRNMKEGNDINPPIVDPLIKLIYDGGDDDKEVDETKIIASLS